MRNIVVLGATGSIGRSTLRVVRRHDDEFRVVAMSAHSSVRTLQQLGREFGVDNLAITDPPALEAHQDEALRGWSAGPESLVSLARLPVADIVVNAVSGAAGLSATIAALEAGKRCALANKESLVAAGALVMEAARRGGGELVPVDSEHSAIMQCIGHADKGEVHRVVLTASGGPFREMGAASLKSVNARMALRHPTWEMGRKISIDSATMANKALEVIEAHHLYGVAYDRIDVVVHPKSIVHSFVEFVDGSVLAQMGEPTMELPILHALTWPRRRPDSLLRGFDPIRCPPLTFEPVDEDRFPLFRLGVDAGRAGGAAPAVYNAANEVVVRSFLEGRVTFPDMGVVVAAVQRALSGLPAGNIDEVLEADRLARIRAEIEVERTGA